MVADSVFGNVCSGASSRLYAVPIEGSATEGASAIYRCPETQHGELVDDFPGMTFNSYWGLILASCKRFGSKDCLGTRETKADGSKGEYKWIQYNEVRNRALHCGSGMINLQVSPEIEVEVPEGLTYGNKFRFMGINSKNREEWTVVDLACNAFGITSVPLYDTLGDEATEFIIDQTRLQSMCADTECVDHLLKMQARLPSLKSVICFDTITVEQREMAGEIRLIDFHKEIMEEGKKNPQEPVEERLDFVATVCYTSGTTGRPKGAVIMNRHLKATCAGAFERPDMFRVCPGDYHISFLPMAHVYERVAQYYVLLQGAAIGYYSGDTLKLLDDIQELRPTMFLTVPRLVTRILAKIEAGVSEKGRMAQWLFGVGLRTKLANYRHSGQVTHAVYDRLVFGKVQKLLGGRVRVLCSGSAPLSKDAQEKVSCFFSCNLIEGWGMTETCALSMVQGVGDFYKGQVGGVCACLEFKVVSVPEMNYDATAKTVPKGELWVRGPSLFSGYFQNPIETSGAISDDGWLKTGDIAAVLQNGAVQIIDRRKNIYKLAQGEYITPERIEGVYLQTPMIAQIFVHGHSDKNCLVAVVVPDDAAVNHWARNKHGKNAADTLEQHVRDPSLIRDILQEMDEVCKTKLKGFEKVKAIHLSSEPFSVSNDLLTATFKIVRHKAKTTFATEIDNLYEEIEANSKKKH